MNSFLASVEVSKSRSVEILHEFIVDLTRNNILFTKALWMLLDILSTWKRDESTHRSPFTLELSARSPSDAKHIFQDIAELQGDYPHFLDSSAQKEHLVRRRNELATHPIQDPPHHFFNAERYFWVAGTRMYVKYRTMRILRLDFSGISESDRRQTPNSTTRLPQVRMITSLLIRRQSYSQLHPGDLGALFTDSLTGLCHIRLEKWRAPCRSGGWKQTGTWWSQRNDISYGPIAHVGPYKSETKELLDLLSRREQLERNGLLVAHLPSSLESLHLMEDIDLCIYGEKLLKIPRQSNILVLKALAISVPHLKHLSISFLSDANECLSFSAGSFPNLESVAFTSQHYLQPSGGKLDDLLHKAATAAMEMPNLQIMELWNCIDGHAAIFRYESRSTAKTTASTLTWRCSWQGWNSVVGGSVIEAWSQVAATNADRRLQFKVEPLRDEASKYAQYGGVLHHLKLRESILDGISEMQVRVGAGTEDETPVAVWKS